MPSRPAIEALRKLTPEEKWRATEPMAAWYALFDSTFDPQELARRRVLARDVAASFQRRFSRNLHRVYGRTRNA